MVDSLKDLNVELPCFRRVKWQTKCKEGIGETLDTETDGSVSEVALLGFFNGVVVDVDDLVQVAGHNLSDLVQATEVVFTTGLVNECWQRQRSQVADSD